MTSSSLAIAASGVFLGLIGPACAWGQPYYPDLDSDQWYYRTDDNVRHYVFEFGEAGPNADPIVVIHGGWGAEHSYLIEPLMPLTDRYRFVLYDQRGSLRTPANPATISVERLVADLDELRESLQLERMTLIAHSMGNSLAYAYLATHPERVKGLVLLNAVHPALFEGPPNEEFVREVWPEADMDALNQDLDAFLSEYLVRAKEIMVAEGILPENLREVPPDQLDPADIPQDKESTHAWRIQFASVNSCTGENWRKMSGGRVFFRSSAGNAIISRDNYKDLARTYWPSLKAFNGPVRVIVGSCDYVDIGPEIWPHIVRQLADAELSVIPNTGHVPWMDEPDLFSESLAIALDSMPSE